MHADKIEDFYKSPHPVGSYFKYQNAAETFVTTLGSRYESYASDVEGAYEKLENGTYSIFDSKQSLNYLIRNLFTNK